MEKPAKVLDYQLTRGFWDGKTLQPKGTVMQFEEGKAPKTAVLFVAPVVGSGGDGAGAKK